MGIICICRRPPAALGRQRNRWDGAAERRLQDRHGPRLPHHQPGGQGEDQAEDSIRKVAFISYHVTGKLQKGSTKVFMTWLTIIACISPKIIKQPCLEKSPFSVLQYFSLFSLFSGISGSSKDLFWNIKRYFNLQQEKVMLRVKTLHILMLKRCN